MNTDARQPLGPDTLPAGAHRAWRSWRRATLHVQQGRVWVTASDRLDDHFVDAGGRLELPARSRVLIGAETGARFSIERPAGRGAVFGAHKGQSAHEPAVPHPDPTRRLAPASA